MKKVDGVVVQDLGYLDPFAKGFTWPAAGEANADSTGDHTFEVSVTIQTTGRLMPWRLLIQDKIITTATSAVTYEEYTVDMLPDTETEFTYTAVAGKSRSAWDHLVLLPAKGDP